MRDLAPKGPWLPYVYAVIAEEAGKGDAAEKLLADALQVDPGHGPSLALVNKLKAERGELDAIKATLADLDAFKDWKSLADVGDALLEAREHADARRAYERSLALMGEAAENDLSRVKRNRLEANAWVESAGFYESVRNMGPGGQLNRLRGIFIKIHPKGCEPKFRHEVSNDTIVSLDFRESRQQLLQPLRGFPLTAIDLGRTRVANIAPLKGMPLEKISLYGTQVSDLAPLAGMPLRELVLDSTMVWDLSPLAGIGLRKLDAQDSKVRDLSPLKGMPLSDLRLGRTGVRDLSPIAGITELRTLKLNNTGVFNLKPLTGLPALTWLDLYGRQNLKDLSPLAKIKSLRNITLAASGVRDISALKGLQLTYFDIGYNKYLQDLTVLDGMPLQRLILPKSAKFNAASKAIIERFRQGDCQVSER